MSEQPRATVLVGFLCAQNRHPASGERATHNVSFDLVIAPSGKATLSIHRWSEVDQEYADLAEVALSNVTGKNLLDAITGK